MMDRQLHGMLGGLTGLAVSVLPGVAVITGSPVAAVIALVSYAFVCVFLSRSLLRWIAPVGGLIVAGALLWRAGFPARYTVQDAGMLAGAGLAVVLAAWMGGILLRARALRWVAIPAGLVCFLAAAFVVTGVRTWVGPVTTQSVYVAMRDGVHLAVDVYLPRALPEAGLPTILHQTRYHRNWQWRFPYSWIVPPHRPGAERFALNQYAYVSVDVRGSGASEGHRPIYFHDKEVRDGGEIVDWIIAQPWSNGSVGSEGVSYVGTTGEFLLSQSHPAVEGAVVGFALYDGYTDIGYPGGIGLRYFAETWTRVNAALDANEPGQISEALMGRVTGVRPVDTDPDGVRLAEIVAARSNYSPLERAGGLTYRYDTADGIEPSKYNASFLYEKAIAESGADIYAVSGWYDGAYPNAAIKRFLNMPRTKLLIGPWDHGGRQAISPCPEDGAEPLDFPRLVLDFHDAVLKNTAGGFGATSPVTYFTLCGSGWNTADMWPPAQVRTSRFHLHASGRVSPDQAETGERQYQVDDTATSGPSSRWVSLANIERRAIGYPDRAAQAAKALVYETDPLQAGLEITGNPVITLHVSSDREDMAVFVYLDDVGPDGDVRYITEGQLRALHRKTANAEDALYLEPGPHRTFLRRDAKPMVPGKRTELEVGLLPVSYFIQPGRRLRISLTGADADNFGLIDGDAEQRTVHHGEGQSSYIDLPVMP